MNMADENVESTGEGIELALPGDNIRKRHIATRASNRRGIIVLVVDGSEFEGYSIGIDSHSLQLLELSSGEVSSIALEYIVSITDGKAFSELSVDDKDAVDRRTSSFRKTCQNWLTRNWPETYDRRGEGESSRQRFNSSTTRRPFRSAYESERRFNSADS